MSIGCIPMRVRSPSLDYRGKTIPYTKQRSHSRSKPSPRWRLGARRGVSGKKKNVVRKFREENCLVLTDSVRAFLIKMTASGAAARVRIYSLANWTVPRTRRLSNLWSRLERTHSDMVPLTQFKIPTPKACQVILTTIVWSQRRKWSFSGTCRAPHRQGCSLWRIWFLLARAATHRKTRSLPQSWSHSAQSRWYPLLMSPYQEPI